MKETMKWLRVSLALLVAVVMSCGLVACGDDDDDNAGGNGANTGTPSGDAVKYDFKSDACPYASLELTADGCYIITRSAAQASYAPTRADNEGGYIIGRYTKTATGEFKLENFGTVTVSGTTMTIVHDDGQNEQWEVAICKAEGNYPQICGTWRVSKYNVKISADGMTVDKTFGSYDELMEFLASMEGDDETDYAKSLTRSFEVTGGEASYEDEAWDMALNELTFTNFATDIYFWEYDNSGNLKEWNQRWLTVLAYTGHKPANSYTWNKGYFPFFWLPTGDNTGKFKMTNDVNPDRYPFPTITVSNRQLSLTIDVVAQESYGDQGYGDEEDGDDYSCKITYTYTPAQ